MLNIFARASVSRVTDPIGIWLVRRGLTPNGMTLIGTAGAVASGLWLFGTGHLLLGTVAVTVFALFDLFDGAMARAMGGGSPFGAVLDASCDRLADGALFVGLTWYCFTVDDNRPLAGAALVCLVLAQVTSYVKASAQAGGLTVDGGLIERAERLILALGGSFLAGLGVPFALDVALWVLAVLSVVTVTQRIVAVSRVAREGT